MSVLSRHVIETISNALKSRMSTRNKSSSIVISVRILEKPALEILWLYREVLNYLLKNFATHHEIAKMRASITRYIQPTNMTHQHNADN